MKRNINLYLFLFVLILAAAKAQAETVLVLSSSEPEYEAVAEGFEEAFKGNYRVINLEGSDERQRLVGEELKGRKPEVTVVAGDLAAQMADWYLDGMPVVYCDTVRAVKTYMKSGKAVGIHHEPDPAEQLKMMRELFPEKNNVGMLYSPEFTPVNEKSLIKDADEMGIKLQVAAMESIKQVPVKLREILPNVDILWVFTDPEILSSHSNQYLVLQSISGGVPIFCGNNDLAHGGATAALVPDLTDVGKKAATEAGRTLTGSAMSGGKVVFPKGSLVLNQKTASLLKVAFPPSIISQAKEVIH